MQGSEGACRGVRGHAGSEGTCMQGSEGACMRGSEGACRGVRGHAGE